MTQLRSSNGCQIHLPRVRVRRGRHLFACLLAMFSAISLFYHLYSFSLFPFPFPIPFFSYAYFLQRRDWLSFRVKVFDIPTDIFHKRMMSFSFFFYILAFALGMVQPFCFLFLLCTFLTLFPFLSLLLFLGIREKRKNEFMNHHVFLPSSPLLSPPLPL